MKFAYHAETKFISSLRVRKFKPALFWGTFDISCAMINSEHRPFSDDNKVIERAAFDEELIEFGFGLVMTIMKDLHSLSYPIHLQTSNLNVTRNFQIIANSIRI